MKSKTQPNVVPLCDILLVLIIIFMVITPLSQSGIDVTIPEKKGPPGNEPPIVLTMGEKGQLFLNAETFSNLEDLKKRLIEIYEHKRKKVIFFKAHKSIPYEKVIDVIDIIKAADVNRICVY
jgi:biopolymer transport protein ExbD